MKELAGRTAVSYFLYPEHPRAAVVFLPGTGASPVFYHPFLHSLYSSGYAVIGYDYPGHGARRGEGLDNFYIPHVLSEVKLLVEEVRKLCELPVVVMGSSMGGIITFYLSIEYSGADAYLSHNAMLLKWISEKRLFLKFPLKLAELFLRTLSAAGPHYRVTTSTYVRWRYVFEDRARLNEFLSHPWCVRKYPLRSIYSLLFYTPPEGFRPEKPVLVITGEMDRVVPVKLQKITADSGGEHVTFRIVRGAGHMLPLEYTDIFIKEIEEWLKNTLQY